jgi:hypothetical protein
MPQVARRVERLARRHDDVLLLEQRLREVGRRHPGRSSPLMFGNR